MLNRSHSPEPDGFLISPFNRCIAGNFPVHLFFLRALFDNGDFLEREAVKRVDKLVDLGFQRGDICVRL